MKYSFFSKTLALLFLFGTLMLNAQVRVKTNKVKHNNRSVKVTTSKHHNKRGVVKAQKHRNRVVVSKPNRPKVIVKRPNYKRPGYVWVEGYWHWNPFFGRYVWKKARWKKIKRNHYWVPGYWGVDPGGFFWVEGYWKIRL